MTKHSFSLSLSDEDYQALKALAESEDRHIYEQARHMLRRELKRLSGEEEPLNLRSPQPSERYLAGLHECCGTPLFTPHEAACPVLASDTSPDSQHKVESPEAAAYVAAEQESLRKSQSKEPIPG